MEIKRVQNMSIELFEKIANIRKQENPLQYMVGVKTVDGRNVCFHTLKAIDCDIATGELIGFNDDGDDIVIEIVPRKMVLFRA